MQNGGLVRIRREPSGWKDRFRKYTVVLDGDAVVKLRNGEGSELAVPAGQHSLEVRIDWTGSGAVEFDVADGETVEFVCGATSVLAVHKAVQASGYVGLARVEGPGT